MPPVTRTRAKALDKAATGESSPATNTISPTSRKRLAMRTRDEAAEDETDKRIRSSSNAEPDAAAPEPQSASEQLEEEATQRLQSLEPDLAPKKEGNSKHVVFGDDDDIDKYVAAAAAETSKQAPEPATLEEAEDSDDAPEAVSTKVAAKETLESAKALADATERQATVLKRKRQERDNLFKEQAQKRRRVPEQPETEGRDATTATTTAKHRRAKKLNLPNVLPAELLEDSSSEDDEDEDETALLRRQVVKKPKKTNFEERAPRDEVVGSTVYRVVAKQVDKKLAPKMHKDTRNVKEDMLRRKRTAVAPNKKKGFFTKR